VWVQLPVDAEQLLAHAEASHHVRFTPGTACGKGMSKWVRLCFAFYTPEELTEGVMRLSKAMQTFVV
jgi:DNA-binding transcriptional MocR family regulator